MGTKRSMIPVLVLQAALVACVAHQPPAGSPTTDAGSHMPAEVADVTWQWVGVTTPHGLLTVDTPERYTIRFTAAGRLEVQADCNRGSTSYSVTEDRRLTLRAIALTRMMCPPGSLSDRFARDVGRAASYFLRDGDLYLDLPVDSGTLRFRRQT